jgi:hypothetical protein
MSSSPAEDIGTYCATQGHGTVGTDIFFNDFPSKPGYPDHLIVFSDTGGFPPDHAMGSNAVNPVFENPSLQVLLQTNDPESGFDTLYSIYKLLDGYSGTLDSVEYLLVTAESSPFLIGKDENDRHRFACNFLIERRPA